MYPKSQAPNQLSEAATHLYFELAKRVLTKAREWGKKHLHFFTPVLLREPPGLPPQPESLRLAFLPSAFTTSCYLTGSHLPIPPMCLGSQARLQILAVHWPFQWSAEMDTHLIPPDVMALADMASWARDMVKPVVELLR